jgi:dTDP-4-dehydrorhamnose reductase
MTRVLVCGANGQLGRELQRARWPSDFTIEALSIERLDITDQRAVTALVEQLRPAVIVNAAAYTAVDRAEDEPAKAFAVNAVGVKHLAQAAARCRARLLHVSTDYVFDGTKEGWYVEFDPVSPLGVYGRSKAEGERVALEYADATVLRTAWLFGALGQNFVRTILRLAREREVIGVVGDQKGCPTAAKDVAKALVTITQAALDRSHEGGLFHLTSPSEASWHELAGAVFDVSKHGYHGEFRMLTTSQYPTRAQRPANSRLDSSLISSTLGIKLPDWRESLAEVVGELEADSSRSH